MNKTKMEHYYKSDSKTLRLDELDYTIIPNSDIKPLLDKLQQENKQLKDNWNKLKEDLINDINYWEEEEKEWIKLGFIKFGGEANNKIRFKKVLNKMQELEQGSDSNE